MRIKRSTWACVLLLLAFGASALPADNIIVPDRSGKAYLKTAGGDLWPMGVTYTTDGFGNIITLGGQTLVSDNLIVPAGEGKAYLKDSLNRLFPAQVIYTTDGNGNVSPLPPAGSGTVTSVAMTLPAWLSVSGSPVTSSGTLAVSTVSQSGNKVLASPANGTLGALSPRALVSADIPSLLHSKISDFDASALAAAYTPATAGNWAVAPTDVQSGLDNLATSGVVKSQAANLVMASPNGSTGVVGPRALVTADIAAAAKAGVSAKVIYVSKDAGNDTTGDGSLLKPFRTIQKGVDTATAAPVTYNNPMVVKVSPGNAYVEDVTISQQGIALECDVPAYRSDHCVISGSITVNLSGTAGGAGFVSSINQAYIHGFVIAKAGGDAFTFSGSAFQRAFLVGCFVQSTSTGSALVVSNSGSNSTLTVRDTDFDSNSSSAATISLSAGKLFISGANPSISNSSTGGAISKSGATSFTLNNASVTGTYVDSGTGSATISNSGITASTSGAVLTLSSSASLTLGVDLITNNTSTGSGISDVAGTITAVGNIFNIGTGAGAYLAKGTGVFAHSVNTYISNKNLQNTLTIVAMANTPTTGP